MTLGAQVLGIGRPPGDFRSARGRMPAPPVRGRAGRPRARIVGRDGRSTARFDLMIAAGMAATMALAALITGLATVFARVGGVLAAAGLFALTARHRRPLAVAAVVSVVVVVEVVPAPEGTLGRHLWP